MEIVLGWRVGPDAIWRMPFWLKIYPAFAHPERETRPAGLDLQ